MGKKIVLQIQEPCHEDWHKMLPEEKGRFCMACQKKVIDFTGYTDRQVATFFKKPMGENVCGRLTNDQLNRALTIPQKRIPWIKYFFQFAIPAFLVSLKTSAQPAIQGKIRVEKNTSVNLPKIKHPDLNQKSIETKIPDQVCSSIKPIERELYGAVGGISVGIEIKTKDRFITGKIIDGKNQPVPFASVIIKGSSAGVAANENGEFKLKVQQKWSGKIQVSCIGYSTLEVEVKKSDSLTVVMKEVQLDNVTLGVIVTTRSDKQKIEKPTIAKPTTNIMQEQPATHFNIYPNPAISGMELTIEWKTMKADYYQITFVNQAGQVVHQRKIWIDADARSLNLQTPSLNTGIYIVKLSNQETGKSFTEKLIIR